MIKFMLKCSALVLVLFFGVLLGMQQANEGLLSMKGYEDNSFGSVFKLTKDEAGEIEASILGNELASHNIKEKQERLEELGAFNFFSSLGSKVAEVLTSFLQATLNIAFQLIDQILSSFGNGG